MTNQQHKLAFWFALAIALLVGMIIDANARTKPLDARTDYTQQHKDTTSPYIVRKLRRAELAVTLSNRPQVTIAIPIQRSNRKCEKSFRQ
jgi:hypothetical protein